MLLQKNIVKKYLALLPDEQTQEAWKWVREPSLDPIVHYFGLVGGFEPPPIQRVGIPSITSRRF